METSPRRETNPNLNPLPSPNSSRSSSSSTNSNNNNGLLLAPPPTTPTAQQQQQQPKPMTRSDTANPYPTTFVQADTNSFKQVVQMLTGSSETANKAVVSASKPDNNTTSSSKHNIPPIKFTTKKQQQQNQQHFKLYERRNSSHLKNHLRLNPLIPNNSSAAAGSNFSPRNTEILSPSILDFPSLVLSPVTPLIPDPFDRSGSANIGFSSGHQYLNKEAEERAIKGKGFYLHPPSPRTPSEPRLLPLFPTTSPRGAGAASGSSSSP